VAGGRDPPSFAARLFSGAVSFGKHGGQAFARSLRGSARFAILKRSDVPLIESANNMRLLVIEDDRDSADYLAKAFREAFSKGRFFNARIRDRYSCEELTLEAAEDPWQL